MNNNREIGNGIIINSKINTLNSASNNTINSLSDSFSRKYDYLWENKNNTNVKGSIMKGIINEYNNIKNQENKDIDNILNQLESLGFNKKYVNECIKIRG